ncbi:MAG: SDR family oxidoreductase, partial [Acidobacteriota bacterium]|nr:SDR family oxidoreductase [Acidobacteriota bacterium]
VNLLLKEFKRIDVLINVAGISVNGFAHKISPEVWRSVIDVNLIGAFNVIRAVLPSMRANNYGRIITISSVVFQRSVVGTSAYSASKSAIIGLTRTIALENANTGITCNCVALGYFDAGLLYQIPEAPREEIRQEIPMKRFGKVHELGNTIQYLIDNEYMTGQSISLNGGLYMS